MVYNGRHILKVMIELFLLEILNPPPHSNDFKIYHYNVCNVCEKHVEV